MKRATLLIFAMVLLVSVAYADDVWKSKPYQQWDLKDVQKILADSPWAHVVHVTASWRKPGEALPVEPGGTTPGNYGTQSGSATGGSGTAAGATSTSSAYGMPGGGAPANANSGSLAQNQAIMNSSNAPEVTFAVRWFSARAVRQALSRAQVLSGGMSEADAAKALADEPTEFAITVVGQDMTPFLSAEEKDLAAKASLQPKKQDKIPATHATVQRIPGRKPEDPRSIAAVVFYFARKSASGDPILAHNEKSVEFLCEAGKATIKVSFDLSKMALANAPDW
jgi:hypothetical protein